MALETITIKIRGPLGNSHYNKFGDHTGFLDKAPETCFKETKYHLHLLLLSCRELLISIAHVPSPC